MNFTGRGLWSQKLLNSPLSLLENVPYLFFEILLVFWQRIVLEQRSLQLLGDQMSVATKLDWTLTVARSFLLLTAT